MSAVSAARTAVLVLAAIAVAVAVELATAAASPVAIGDGVAGGALLGAGAVALGAERGRASGALLMATGAAWLAGTLDGGLVFLHRGLLVHLVLAYPRLWPGSRPVAAVIAGGYLCALITPLARSAGVTLALAAALALTAAVRARAAAGVERRARSTAVAAAGAIGAALTVAAAGRLAGGSLDSFALWSYNAAVALTAVGLGADLRWGRWTHAAASELVGDLGELGRPGALRDRLARTLGDPDLALGYRTAGGYADEAGRRVEPPPAGGQRSAAYVEDAGERVALLVHDASLLDDRRLLDAALSAARLAAANERMQGEVRAGIVAIEASRRRLVEAAIEQRQALEAELRTGAEHRLAAVTDRLSAIPDEGGSVTALVDSVERAREDLRRFAQGIHPVVLTEQGLGPALEEAAAMMPLEVVVDAPAQRLPASVEVTVYFLCTEALANVGKHASATRVEIAVRRTKASVDATVQDNGRGGADLARGTGLRGLADRIEALGGSLALHSPAGEGTCLRASIPI
jgi:signal transduction histidine kinase